MAVEQDQLIKACSRPLQCQEAYYTRALVALFQNRADAITAFQELHTMMPDGRHAASSTRWLYLLQESSASSNHKRWVLEQLRQEVLHELLGRGDASFTSRTEQAERPLTQVQRDTRQQIFSPK